MLDEVLDDLNHLVVELEEAIAVVVEVLGRSAELLHDLEVAILEGAFDGGVG